MAPDLEREIDTLYQLPLEEFTSARNALAKQAGSDGGGVKALQKPPIAAWAVNQLYWKRRGDYDALVEAAKTLGAAHKAVLGGKRADLRAASEEHERALERALRSTLALLSETGQPATDSTKHAILTTLRALPADEPPGRLTRVLQPGGFELLAGLPIASSGAVRTPAPTREKKAAAQAAGKPAKAAADAKELARAREAVTTAARELRLAEHAARREEFEAARAARDAEKAAGAVETARAELEAAHQALEQAESDAKAAARKRDAAEKRARETEDAVASARARLADAEKAVTRLAR